MIGHTSPPVDLGRDEARELARDELLRPGYERGLSWPARILEWVLDQLDRLVSGASEAIPDWLGTLLLLAAVVAIAVIVVLRTGPPARRQRRGTDPIFAERRRTAAEHRAAAERASEEQDWTTAVLERFRSVVAGLEERGVIDPRTGRTADEVARDAGDRLPDTAAALTKGARRFDHVLYGGGDAGPADDDTMRELDETVPRARPRDAADDGPALAVPR